MCTSKTETIPLEAHGRGIEDWTRLSTAVVYYDHPVRASTDHAVVLDLRDESGPLSSRVVLEMSAACAARLARAIDRVLESELARAELAGTAISS